jgi:hypothetical protein
MNIVFVAPLAARTRALAVETRRAADSGHRVLLISEQGSAWDGAALDERVATRWIGASGLTARESALVAFAGRKAPLGVLRRIGRGPLRGPAKRAARKWRREVVKDLDKRLKRRTGELRESLRIEQVRTGIREWDADWVVLHEPHALKVSTGFLPGMLDARPQLKTTFFFDEPAEGDADGR